MSLERFFALLGSVAATAAGIATAIYYLTKTFREKTRPRPEGSNSEAHQLRQALAELHEKLMNALTAHTAQPQEDTAPLRQRIAHLEFRLAEILAQSRETAVEGSNIPDQNTDRKNQESGHQASQTELGEGQCRAKQDGPQEPSVGAAEPKPIPVPCPSCGVPIQITPKLWFKRVRCRACKTSFRPNPFMTAPSTKPSDGVEKVFTPGQT